MIKTSWRRNVKNEMIPWLEFLFSIETPSSSCMVVVPADSPSKSAITTACHIRTVNYLSFFSCIHFQLRSYSLKRREKQHAIWQSSLSYYCCLLLVTLLYDSKDIFDHSIPFYFHFLSIYFICFFFGLLRVVFCSVSVLLGLISGYCGLWRIIFNWCIFWFTLAEDCTSALRSLWWWWYW